METEDSYLRIVDTILSEAVDRGIFHLAAEDEQLRCRKIHVDGQELINFGSCSYLGLEMDPRLKQGVVDAVNRYGTQFSSSRSYVSSPPYRELEALLAELFDAYPLITASTTLGHLAALPVLVGPRDAVILDQQVHQSVKMAAHQCQVRGTPTQLVRHSRMDLLEKAIRKLRARGAYRIWYFADGVYSMFGDLAPLDEIRSLLGRYEGLHVYIDDAHGMSWTGRNGRGWVLGERNLHPRMVVAVSLNKSFAAAGGAVLFPNPELLRRVRTCGPTMMFSGPIQPPMIGAAVASAKIHLSDEIHQMQADLHEKIRYCNRLLQESELPLVAESLTPIRFVGVGLLSAAMNVVARLKADGYYVNLAPFPAVPMKGCGIRIALNRHLESTDLEGLVQALAHHLPRALEEEDHTFDFQKTFGAGRQPEAQNTYRPPGALALSRFASIEDLDAVEWNRLFGDCGLLSQEGLRFLERTFRDRLEPENNWGFRYFVVRDGQGEIVLATFFTDTLFKDDMLAPESVSPELEREREELGDPYFFSSPTLTMGSLLTESSHLYLDRARDWQGAMLLLLEAVEQERARLGAETVILRDLPAGDREMEAFLLRQGFVSVEVPATHILELGSHRDAAGYVGALSRRQRERFRRGVRRYEHLYRVEVLGPDTRSPTQQELESFYGLYLNVKRNGHRLNVFDLPQDIFQRMCRSPGWEFLALRLISENRPDRLAAVGACYYQAGTYCPTVIGLDYECVRSHGAYRQAIFQAIRRALELGARRVLFGKTGSEQKRQLGARAESEVAFFRSEDNYKMEVLGQMKVERRSLIVS